MMDCLYAKCKFLLVYKLLQNIIIIQNLWFLYDVGTPYITDCVMGELEKLGSKYRIALKIVKDPRFERLPCFHKGTYADDCLVQRVTQVFLHIFVIYSCLGANNFEL
jgi:U3 small nucleolar RNA-associated protein 24